MNPKLFQSAEFYHRRYHGRICFPTTNSAKAIFCPKNTLTSNSCQTPTLELKMPDYMSEITKLVQTEGSKMSDILVNGVYMLLCALGSLVFAVFTGYIISSLASIFSMKVRKKLFDKIGNLSIHEIKLFSTSSLITRTTNDVTQVEMLIGMGLQMLVKAPVTAIWAITKIMNKLCFRQ